MADDADAAGAINIDTADIDEADAADTGQEPTEPSVKKHARRSPTKLAAALGLVMLVAISALVSWLGMRAYQSHQRDQERALFVQTARQGALNLTTIDYTHPDADVQRILDSATGTFYDDFAKRSQPFIEVVKQAKSTSQGTVTEAGLESTDNDTAHVLVAVMVKTSNAGAAEQQPRAWRMRISVQKLGDSAKVSNVEFVA
jgi:Mce-associated membrane protein